MAILLTVFTSWATLNQTEPVTDRTQTGALACTGTLQHSGPAAEIMCRNHSTSNRLISDSKSQENIAIVTSSPVASDPRFLPHVFCTCRTVIYCLFGLLGNTGRAKYSPEESAVARLPGSVPLARIPSSHRHFQPPPTISIKWETTFIFVRSQFKQLSEFKSFTLRSPKNIRHQITE